MIDRSGYGGSRHSKGDHLSRLFTCGIIIDGQPTVLAANACLTRMRNAKVAMINLRGVATEAIKNVVLAGIGKLVLVDPGRVTPEDLGAGFFFSEDDVGRTVSPTTLTASPST